MKDLFMSFAQRLISEILVGTILEVRIGLNWTTAVVEMDGIKRCGLASTIRGEHKHTGEPIIPDAGYLNGRSTLELAAWLKSGIPSRRSVAMAVINASLPQNPDNWVEQNVEELLASLGKDRRVALIGHFPFVPRLRDRIERFDVIDRYPRADDYPESAAPEILPRAELVAITGMTLLNGTFGNLLTLCSPEALVLLIGPSTPLSPTMFELGVDILAGSTVTNIEAVLRVVGEGGNFRQVKKAGVRLVTMNRPNLKG
jgi:uncharacterized protein (DUF4213/DUF364 family)